MERSLLELIIELINALARLGVPLTILIIILKFKKEISDILKRLKRGKVLGQEIELNDQLNKLEEHITESKKIIPDSHKKLVETKLPEKTHYKEFKEILEKSNKDPKEALYVLSILVESELKNLSATHGHIQYFSKGFNFLRAVSVLQNNGIISNSTASSIKQFYKLSNNITHAQIETTEEEIMRLIDLGSMLLNLIRAIPRETYEVFDLVEVYKDKNCTHKYEDISGILLKVTSLGKKIVNYRIYPTTKKDYNKGQVLSWEWNMEKSWSEAWYKSPITNNIESAWDSAAEFAGRPLDKIPLESWE